MCRPLASGNGDATVVDLAVMRIYRRTGENTAISYSLGAALFGLFLLVGLVGVIGDSVGSGLLVTLGVGAALTVGFWLHSRR